MAVPVIFASMGVQAEPHWYDKWNEAVQPFQIYGNSYYVGVKGLSAVLVTSPEGHILIDGALPTSAPLIAASVRALGFRLEDIKLILNSHTHFDHAGGIAELQKLTGATVLASPSGARALERGRVGRDDPQFTGATPFPAVRHVRVLHDGQVVKLGALALTAHFTPGHTPGGTSWSWSSCVADRCAGIVYADSINPVSSDDFKYSANTYYPHALRDFKRSFAVLREQRCDILVAVHPDATGMWETLAAASTQAHPLLGDTNACKEYVDEYQTALDERLAKEKGTP